MADKICTNFIDDNGLDIGCYLVSKEYVLEAYPELVPWMKTPALWLWGGSSLGDNSSIFSVKSSPVQTISGGTNWKQASVGAGNTAAIKTDGTLWLWGASTFGLLGENILIGRSSPVQTISGGTNWKSVEMTRAVAAIKTDGTLWTWGCGTAGNLGNGQILSQSSPVQTVSNVTTWKQASVSLSGYHTAATKIDGTLWIWGLNTGVAGTADGILGDNTIISKSSPVQTVSNVTTWKQVSLGKVEGAAIKTDGTLWTWGNNAYGQLGINVSGGSRSSPVQTISNVQTWKTVSLGDARVAAIKTDGSLWTWGRGTLGALGNDLVVNQSSPVQTISGGVNWKVVSVSCNHMAAIKTDGSLWLWGQAAGGILANSGTINRSSPVQTISGGTDWKHVAAGCILTAAIRDESDF